MLDDNNLCISNDNELKSWIEDYFDSLRKPDKIKLKSKSAKVSYFLTILTKGDCFVLSSEKYHERRNIIKSQLERIL